ncbi:Acetyltransferase (GNAT) domain-containing protein [Parelusimicrobium proximum]|uniref:GNAT family N-acetyltransferase n=1 Tax=Parelusimicrobium proximum TaxID=3228953 RepID=UPI003D179E06
MIIKSLAGVSVSEMVKTINEAFSDYVIALQMTEAQLEARMKADSVDLSLSAGAFEGDNLKGLILHGIGTVNGRLSAYNALTGVTPRARGQHLTQKMYEYTFNNLRKKGIHHAELNVITSNSRAVKVYEDIGFKKTIQLLCYKGSINIERFNKDVHVAAITNPDFAALASFRSWDPAWSNSDAAVKNGGDDVVFLGAYEGGELAGYAAYNKVLARVQQFAVDKTKRGRGIGSALFKYTAEHFTSDIGIINIAEGDRESQSFLTYAGLSEYIRQYEMTIGF